MKKSALAICFIGASLTFSQTIKAVELSVTISDVVPGEGQLYVRVYDTQSTWLSTEKDGPRLTEVVVLKDHKEATEITKTFDLPTGSYAITATQDINENGYLDRDWMGKPAEPTGSTGDGQKKQGPPAFEDCVLELKNKTQKNIRLLQY